MAWEIAKYRNPQEADLLIAIPHTGFVRIDWALSFKHLDMPPGVGFITRGTQGQPINIARNMMVTYALQQNAKHLFFLDSDVEMPRDGLVKLYQAKKPIVAGVYRGRAPPHGLSANVNKMVIDVNIIDKYPNQLIDVHEIGMGCALIDTRVFKKIAQKDNLQWRCMKLHGKELNAQGISPDVSSPKEVAQFHNDDAISLGYKCGFCGNSLIADFFRYTIGTELSSTEGPYSEDYYFCQKARKYGFPITIHSGVFCEHEMTQMKLSKDGMTNPVASAVEI